MIDIVTERIKYRLLREENEKDEKKVVNKEILNKTSVMAIEQDDDWENLSFVNNMMMEVLLEQTKS